MTSDCIHCNHPALKHSYDEEYDEATHDEIHHYGACEVEGCSCQNMKWMDDE